MLNERFDIRPKVEELGIRHSSLLKQEKMMINPKRNCQVYDEPKYSPIYVHENA